MKRVLFLIGQIGAGKTTVSRVIADATGAAFLDIAGQRHASTSLRDQVARLPTERVVIECGGASADFEAVLESLVGTALTTIVKLVCPPEVAIQRKRCATALRLPRYGGNWAPHVLWTDTRLRSVPADATFDTGAVSLAEVSAEVISLWERSRPLSAPTGNLSFSALALWERCPLAYRFKHVDNYPGRFPRADPIIGSAAHAALAWLYADESVVPGLPAFLDRFRAAVSRTTPPGLDDLRTKVTEAETALAFHYDTSFRTRQDRTVGTEVGFSLDLGGGLSYSGVIDRVCESQGGWTCAIDYKLTRGRRFLASNVPDMLQIETYGVALMALYRLPVVEVRRHALPTGEEEVRRLTLNDIPRVKSAVRRWATRFAADHDYAPLPTKLCGWCQFRAPCPAPYVA